MSDIIDIVSAMGGYQAATPQDKAALEALLGSRGGRQRGGGGVVIPTEPIVGDIIALRVRDATPLDPDGGSPAVGIDGNGWVAEVTIKGLTAPAAISDADALFDTQKLELLVADPGFDANTNPATVYRRIKGRALLRKQYKTAISDPRQRFISQAGADMTVMVALSDQLYAG